MRRPMLTSLWFPFGQVLFGLWLFEWLPVKPPRWLTEGAAVDPIIAYPERARVVFLSLLIMISVGLFIWIDTSRLCRRLPGRDLPAMVRLILSSRRGAMTFVVLALSFGNTAWCVFPGVPLDSYLVRFNLVIACGVLMIILLPPTAIVLGSSSGSGQLLETAARHLFPFRVVSLLDGKYLGRTIFASRSDNLRTILGKSWRESVHRLVEITRLVIIDARTATPAVCEEIRYMLDPSRVGKAVFIVKDDCSAPRLEEAGVDTRQVPVVCYRANDVPHAIARFKGTGSVTPVTAASEFNWRSKACAECGREIKVLVHKTHGLGAVPISRQLLRLMDEGKVKGSFYCRQCERCYCYECSEIDQRCGCGKNAGWGETVYIQM